MLIIKKKDETFSLELSFEDYVTAKSVLNKFENNKLPEYYMCERCGRIIDVLCSKRTLCNLCQKYEDLLAKARERNKTC